MNFWILLTFTALAECRFYKREAYSCPDLCSCSFLPSGAELDCTFPGIPVSGLPSKTTRLSIQSTNLSSITARHLVTVPLLMDLQLYHTNLSGLPADLLKDLPRLIKLDLTGNSLVRLPPNVFSHASLASLVLKNNLIEEVDSEWFPDNSSLTWLDLSGNRLRVVPAAVLHKMPKLEDLDLSDNHLVHLEPDALKNLRRLERLNLAGNQLINLNPSTFSHNLKLSHLFLQENQLQELPATLLQDLQHLEMLFLQQNRLQNLPSGLLDQKKSSMKTILMGNPWDCNERLEYLWKWLSSNPQNVFFLEEVTCAGPELLKNRQVVSLTGDELGIKMKNFG